MQRRPFESYLEDQSRYHGDKGLSCHCFGLLRLHMNYQDSMQSLLGNLPRLKWFGSNQCLSHLQRLRKQQLSCVRDLTHTDNAHHLIHESLHRHFHHQNPLVK